MGMTDLERVLQGLDCVSGFGHCLQSEAFAGGICAYCMKEIAKKAKELLKEQEPILLENQHKPYGISTNANSPWISRCPRCGKKVEGKQTRFCKYCGQAVKWDG